MSIPISIKFNYEEELFSIKNFDISEPYFINGLIKTNISWNKINDHRFQQYDLHWIETQCYSDVTSCCYRRDAVTIENYFQLNDLRFNYGTIRPPCQTNEKRSMAFLPSLNLIVTRNISGIQFYWSNILSYGKTV
jgi:hypothetical protein